MSFEQHLGLSAMFGNGSPTGARAKLAESEIANVKDPAARKALFMLATFVFDHARRFQYLYKVTNKYMENADPDRAAELKRDNELLTHAIERQDYVSLSYVLEAIWLRMVREHEEEHEARIEALANKSLKT